MDKDRQPNRRMSELRGRGHETPPAQVYYVESDQDESVLVGINVQIRGEWISWFDTVKERVMRGKMLENSLECLSFRRDEDDGGQTYSFTPMTLDIYNSSVKNKLVGRPEFSNQQAMLEAFGGMLENAQ